jgi:hypothetical protein
MGARRRLGAFAVLGALLVALGIASSAPAERIEGLPNWPAMAPPDPNDAPGTAPLTFDLCPSGKLACGTRTIDEMKSRWRGLDASCDHRAVFALTYLRTTQEYFRTVKHHHHFFSDRRWIEHLDAVFAQLYFRAYDRYVAGKRVPGAWRVAFDTAASPNETGIGDLLLGMNAHIDRDLPYAIAHVGLVKPNGDSRKADHDKVNRFLDRVIDPLQKELARRYDRLFADTDAEPSPFDETAALAAVRSIRENAWRNAERLVNANGRQERQQVRDSIEAESTAGAETIRPANAAPGYGPMRDAYCQAQQG